MQKDENTQIGRLAMRQEGEEHNYQGGALASIEQAEPNGVT